MAEILTDVHKGLTDCIIVTTKRELEEELLPAIEGKTKENDDILVAFRSYIAAEHLESKLFENGGYDFKSDDDSLEQLQGNDVFIYARKKIFPHFIRTALGAAPSAQSAYIDDLVQKCSDFLTAGRDNQSGGYIDKHTIKKDIDTLFNSLKTDPGYFDVTKYEILQGPTESDESSEPSGTGTQATPEPTVSKWADVPDDKKKGSLGTTLDGLDELPMGLGDNLTLKTAIASLVVAVLNAINARKTSWLGSPEAAAVLAKNNGIRHIGNKWFQLPDKWFENGKTHAATVEEFCDLLEFKNDDKAAIKTGAGTVAEFIAQKGKNPPTVKGETFKRDPFETLVAYMESFTLTAAEKQMTAADFIRRKELRTTGSASSNPIPPPEPDPSGDDAGAPETAPGTDK